MADRDRGGLDDPGFGPGTHQEADLIRERLWDSVLLAGSIGLLVWLLPWPLILSPTMPVGGDTPSHYSALLHFRDHILPRFRLWGWDPGNLAGFPSFQFYFPLPFLAMVGLGHLLDQAVAFKLLVLAPALTLPLSTWFSLRRLGLAFPGPAVGAALSLCFLLQETNQVWGGNLASILAGEFCYAWALNLVLIYLGLLPGWIKGERGPVLPAWLLFLIGLCHAYGLLFSLAAGLYLLLEGRGFWRAAVRLLVVYGLAFFLLGLWLIPMLVYSPYTEMFNFIWVINSWRDFLPQTLWPVFILAGLGLILTWWLGEREDRFRSAYLTFWILVAATLYLLSPFMNAVTIRFVPFGHLALVLLAAQGVVLVTQRLTGKGMVGVVVLLAAVTWTGSRLTYLDHWLNWNNAGLERQALWPTIRRLADHLEKEAGPGTGMPSRVAYEHSSLNSKAGSVRIFESLPLLAGRPTLEGLYLQASPNAPFIFYLQSEISQRGSAPLPGYVYSRLNLDRAVEHLRLFNVGQYLVVDPRTKTLADHQPNLYQEGTFGPYSVYRVLGGREGYAVVPEFRPVLAVTDRPQELAFQWFRFTDLKVPLVFTPRTSGEDKDLFAGVLMDWGENREQTLEAIRSGRLPRQKLETRTVEEKVSGEEIVLRGLAPGRPVLIRSSYHPAWRSDSGERIYRASPAFMLVFPKGESLRLRFGWAWPHGLGLALTGLGLILSLVFLIRPLLLSPAVHEYGALGLDGRGSGGWLRVAAAVLWAAGLTGLWLIHDDASSLRNRARSLSAQGDLAGAQRLFKEGLARFPMSLVVDFTCYDLAMTYVDTGQWSLAEEYFRMILSRFPDSVLLPETLYHQGVCLKNLDRPEEAGRAWERLRREFGDSPWAERARKAAGEE